MPWLETGPLDERERYTMADLCARYNVSRKTGYKWIDRMEEGGRAALRDRSRAPHRCSAYGSGRDLGGFNPYIPSVVAENARRNTGSGE